MSVRIQNLSFSYGAAETLSGVSFEAREGELTAVLGPNGAGKTTLFRCILGFLPDYTGSVTVDGDEAKRLPARELARRLAYIPQGHGQNFGYTVLDMVLMGTAHALPLFSMPGADEKKRALASLERLGIAHLRDKNIGKISGGEQQLVLMARALAQQSGTLVMDEPASALDFGNQDKLMSLARSLAREGHAVILSTHNPQHALFYADKAVALRNGRVIACGAPRDCLDETLLQTLYGVRVSLADTPSGPVIVPEMPETEEKE